MKIITVSSLKGGVGKTTSAIFLSFALASWGKRVLMVDLDHNNNLTDFWLRGAEAEAIEGKGIYQALTRALSLEASIWQDVGGDTVSMGIIPATPTLACIGVQMARDPGVVLRLRSGLRKLDFDYVIIDTPPSLSLELTIGLHAADLVLAPVSASRWTLQGYQIIAEEVAKVGEAGLPVPGILAVPSMVTEIEGAAIRAADAWKSASVSILRDQAIKGAANAGKALRPGTRASGWFEALATEIAKEVES